MTLNSTLSTLFLVLFRKIHPTKLTRYTHTISVTRSVSFTELEMDSVTGIRFFPTDEEIIRLLQFKRQDPGFSVPAISEANIYDHEPENLSRLPAIRSDEKWSSFYCEPNYIKSSSERVNRSTRTGYWKVTGKPCEIKAKCTHEVIGCKRTLVFYQRFPGSKEVRTNWVMREFSAKPKSDFKKDYVVCRVKRKRDKKQHISIKTENRRAKKPLIFTNVEGCHQVAFEDGNRVAERSSPESQLLPNCHLISTSSCPDVEEIISPELQLLPSHYSIFNSRIDAVENADPELDYHLVFNSLVLEDLNALNGFTGLEHTSSTPLQSPVLPEQLESSYCFVSSNDNKLLNSPSGCELRLEDCLQLQEWVWVSPDEFPGEETGHSPYLSF